MSFALPGILIILGLVPGIAFLSAYYSGPFARRFAQISAIDEITRALVLAMPLDTAWFLLKRPSLAFVDTLVALVTGAPRGGIVAPPPSAVLYVDGPGFVWSYLLLVLAAVLLGWIARNVVWSFRMDLVFHALQMKSEWYYLLNGRNRKLPRWNLVPHADVLTSHPDGSRLYRGAVKGFDVNRDGTLSRVVLTNAERGAARDAAFEWKPIPGDSLVLMGSHIHSINMRYVTILPADESPSQEFRRVAGAVLYSLFTGET